MDMKEKKLIEYAKNHQYDDFVDFLKENPDVNLSFTDSKGRTLLHHVCAKISEKGLPFIQILLEHKLDPNAQSEFFESPLEIAMDVNNIAGVAKMNYFLEMKKKEDQSYL